MKILDARNGQEVHVGEWVTYPPPQDLDGRVVGGVMVDGKLVDPASYRILIVWDHFFSATVDYQTADGVRRAGQLAVRFFHPDFFLQSVAFVPS